MSDTKCQLCHGTGWVTVGGKKQRCPRERNAAPRTVTTPPVLPAAAERETVPAQANPFDEALMKIEVASPAPGGAPEDDSIIDPVKGAASKMDAKAINLKLNRAFYNMLKDFPYYSRIAYSFKRRPTPGLGTVAVDKYWRFYYDPEVIQDWTEEQVAGALAHEVGHCIRGTNERWEDLGEDPDKHMLFNICSDALINSDLREIKKNNPSSFCEMIPNVYYLETMREKGHKAEADMTTEEIFYSAVEKIDNDCTCNDSKEQKQQDGTDGEPCPVHGEQGEGEGQGQGQGQGEGQEQGEGQGQGQGQDPGQVQGEGQGQGQGPGESQGQGQGQGQGEGQEQGQGQGGGSWQSGAGKPNEGKTAAPGSGGKYDIAGSDEKGFGAGDCGSIADGIEREYEDPDGEKDGLNKRRQDRIVDMTADDIIRFDKSSQGRGTVGGGLLRWAEERKRPQVNWKTQLRRIVNRQIQQAGRDGGLDYTRYSRNSMARRGGGRDATFTPAVVGPTPPSISVVADTSGSMSDEMIAWGLGEMEGILKQAAPESGVQFLAVDAEAGTPKPIKNVKQVKELMRGGGGTDMRVGISSIMDQPKRKRPQVIILVTDGYTPYPAEPLKGTKLIVALTASGARESVPDWATTVMIDPEEAKREIRKRNNGR